jgi:hypothetical protein
VKQFGAAGLIRAFDLTHQLASKVCVTNGVVIVQGLADAAKNNEKTTLRRWRQMPARY